MRAVVKEKYVGQYHTVHGVLLAGVVYEVPALGELFLPAPEAVKRAAKPAKEE